MSYPVLDFFFNGNSQRVLSSFHLSRHVAPPFVLCGPSLNNHRLITIFGHVFLGFLPMDCRRWWNIRERCGTFHCTHAHAAPPNLSPRKEDAQPYCFTYTYTYLVKIKFSVLNLKLILRFFIRVYFSVFDFRTLKTYI